MSCVFCSGIESILSAADHFTKPFITKHNRAGRGLGVKLFQNKFIPVLNTYEQFQNWTNYLIQKKAIAI